MSQPATNPPRPSKSPASRVIIIVVVALAVVATILVIVLPLLPSKPETPSAALATSTPTPPPADPAKASSAPLFAGFEALSDIGMSQDQIMSLKYGFTKFIKTSGKTIKSINVIAAAAVQHDRFSASTSDAATFRAALAGDTVPYYAAKVEYSGTSAAHLYLFDATTSALVYDSGLIDLYNGVGDN